TSSFPLSLHDALPISMVRNIAFLIDAAQLLQIPVTATEALGILLGPTTAELARRLPVRPEKTAFSCCAIPSVVEGFRRGARPKRSEEHTSELQSRVDL